MKLYDKPGACSLASHIVLLEVGVAFELDRVDTGAMTTASGEDFATINPKGYVPALRLDDGRVLTEGAAILQYIAEQNPAARPAPPAGTFERAKLQEQLNYVASELHKAFGAFFAGTQLDGAARARAEANVLARLRHIESALGDGRAHLGGERFSVADAYLFVVAGWSRFVGIALDHLPRHQAFLARVGERPATQATMRAEGLFA